VGLPLSQETAEDDAGRAADQVGGQGKGGGGQRQAVERLQDGAGEVLDDAERGRDQEEEQEAQPDGA